MAGGAGAGLLAFSLGQASFMMEDLITEIQASRKYRSLELPESTLRDLVAQEQARGRSGRDLEKAVREKLHHIVAPYLGDPDYATAVALLENAFTSGSEQVRSACCLLLAAHASTRERLPAMDFFYHTLFEVTGLPTTVLDLACGLHPLGLPWMGLPTDVRYLAYDLHKPRIDLINHFFRLSGTQGRAIHQDILVQPPESAADVAFFFKEAHRFEQRQRGCNRAFWQAVRARWLLVSLPANSLTGKHQLADRQRALVARTTEGLNWQITEIQILDELVFCIQKEI